MEHAIIEQVLLQVDKELEEVEFMLRTASMPLTKKQRDVIVNLMKKVLQKENDALQQFRILREFEANTISEADVDPPAAAESESEAGVEPLAVPDDWPDLSALQDVDPPAAAESESEAGVETPAVGDDQPPAPTVGQ